MELGTHNVKGTAYAVAAVVFAGAASAVANASLSATLTGYAAGGFEQVGFNSTLGWDSGTAVTLWSVRAQQHAFSESNGNQFLSWCAEVYQGVAQGSTYTFDVVAPEQAPGGDVAPGPMGAIKAALINDLYRRYYADLAGATQVGAFQLAIYEITHENLAATSASQAVSQLALDKGAFQSGKAGGLYATAASMLASLGQGGFGSMGPNLLGLSNASAQDQLLVVPIGAPAVLAGFGLIGLGFMRRRMK